MYQVLYRKWRPRTFKDVVGQEHVTGTLANELAGGRIPHAFLFTGSRGTGKTSCAKILAKAVNCPEPVEGNPCNKCEICTGIDSGAVLDVVEIDAASNNGVDNIRDLRDEANFTPVKAKYRVYIIDEVHMLSAGAFNALLKTLEEPPSHVIFILATTEVHKLPATILSRCQRFDFKRISPEDIAKRLREVAAAEGITLEEDAAVLIARIADGALRDALSLLDLCSANNRVVTSACVGEAAGLADRDYLFELASCVNTRGSSRALELIHELHNNSCDMERLCSELINHLRSLMIVKTVKSAPSLLICTAEDFQRLKQQTENFTLEEILYSLSVLEETFANLRKGVNKRIEMEMAFIKLCSVNLNGSSAALLSRVSALEAALLGGAVVKPAESPVKEKKGPLDEIRPKEPAAKEPEAVNDEPELGPDDSQFQFSLPDSPEDTAVSAGKEETADAFEMPFDSWPEVLKDLFAFNKPFAGLLAGSKAVLNGETVLIDSENKALDSFMKTNPSYVEDLKKSVLTVTGKQYKIKIYEKKQEPVTGENTVFLGLKNKIAKFNNQ